MRGLNATEVLALWETGLHQTTGRRALDWLATVSPGVPVEALARLPLGQRDALLLDLRELTFGSRISCLADCPTCGEPLQVDFDTADIRTSGTPGLPVSRVSSEGFTAEVRLPDTMDMEAAGQAADPDAARRILMERCVSSFLKEDGTAARLEQMPNRLIQTISHELASADPQADTELELDCPDCGTHWVESFDIVAYFWTELQASARGLLLDVHVLASTYGWSEAQVLALSPPRRAAYLDLLRK